MPARISFLLLMVISTAGFAQPGYKLDFKIKGLKDTTAFLAYSDRDQSYLRDTAKVSSQGAFTFEGQTGLQQGIFMVVLGNVPLFQFVIGLDQRFLIETDKEDYLKHAVVTGDEDNKLFFDNANFLAQKYKEADPYIKVLRDSTLKPEAKKAAQEEFQKYGKMVEAFQDDIIEKHPTTLTARMIKSTKEIEVPEAPKKADGSVDSTFQFRYYRDHYFDNFDLSDDALIRLPKSRYQEKVKDYLDRLFVQQADTLTKEINRLASKVKKNSEAYKHLIWTCLSYYQTHPIMGLDQVYVNIYDKYVATGEMDFWLDKTAKKSIAEYVGKIRLSMIGNTAPNLIMQDKDFQPKSLYDIKNKYTILFFFSPDCGHCKEETPKLVDFYNKSKGKFDFEVYAVSTDTSMKKMRDFIRDFKMPWTTVNGPRTYVGHWSKLYYAETTPTMYVIDTKRRIIAKKLGPEQLADFFTKYDMMTKKPTARPGSKGN